MNESDLYKNYTNPLSKTKKIKRKANKKRNWLIALSTIAVIFIVFLFFIYSGLPSLEELENPKPQLASKVYSADGELLGQFFIENRIETSIDSLPTHLIEALIATEDRQFYDHWGVDVFRFFKAMVKNVFSLSLKEGASTITQQLARNLYELKVTRESQFDKAIRKIREWITAVQIEKNFTKDEIIELYLNVSYFGKSSYGVEAASRVYFNKKANELSLPESALFIALLKSPRDYDPERNYENAFLRRNLVMHNMLVTGMLSESEYEELKQDSIVLASERLNVMKTDAPHFMEYVRLQMSEIADEHGVDLYRDGLNIYTTLDLRMQKIANDVCKKHLQEYQEIFNKYWKWNHNTDLLATIIDETIRNSKDYKNASSSEEKAGIYNNLKNDEQFIERVKSNATKIEVGFVVIDPFNGQTSSRPAFL